ncbi:thiopeptide-type bacteriocin biosynthesis protein [Streptomyces sp. NPDC004296]|uniref:thiopeptide-type bacteriocin biosynthesis protein n=1 Tax=Streptomyces sp. NPDC004296 TaxID=3364697 RepID=UPI0036931F4A
MPVDRLTVIDRAVLDVLAGQPVDEIARRADMHPAHLADAVELFQQAGHDALAHQTSQLGWQQIFVEFLDWSAAESTAATYLEPVLSQAQEAGFLTGWWFIRKHPCWRLRLHALPESTAVADLSAALDHLREHHHVKRWWPGIYEPETTAFGGTIGIGTAHQLFIADSREILRLAARPDIVLGRRELSVLLCSAMMRGAGLEWYEAGDVWDRVISEEGRSAVEEIPEERRLQLVQQLRTLLQASTAPEGPNLAVDGPLHPVANWVASFRDTGAALGAAAHAGQLDRGLRQILALHVIFHWNRLGLSHRTQSALAWSARQAVFGLL